MLLVGRKAVDGAVWWAGLMLSSQDHDRDEEQEAAAGRHWMDVGTGAWDREGRPERGAPGPAARARGRRHPARGRRARPGDRSTGSSRRPGGGTRSSDLGVPMGRLTAGLDEGGSVAVPVARRPPRDVRRRSPPAPTTAAPTRSRPASPAASRRGRPRVRRVGDRGGGCGLPRRRRGLRQETDEVNVELTTYPTHRELVDAIKAGRRPRRLPRRPRRPGLPARAGRHPADRRAARRARRRLRRRLLAGRAGGVLLRPRPAVHALRHLAVGRLLQHRRSSTSS